MEERIKPCCRGLWGHKDHERGYTAGLTAVTQPPSSTAPLQTGLGWVPYILGCPGQALGGGQAKAGRSLWPTLPGAVGRPRGSELRSAGSPLSEALLVPWPGHAAEPSLASYGFGTGHSWEWVQENRKGVDAGHGQNSGLPSFPQLPASPHSPERAALLAGSFSLDQRRI